MSRILAGNQSDLLLDCRCCLAFKHITVPYLDQRAIAKEAQVTGAAAGTVFAVRRLLSDFDFYFDRA